MTNGKSHDHKTSEGTKLKEQGAQQKPSASTSPEKEENQPQK
ncbi:hypothetical protein [Gimesia fumaroli]|uniref:Uncharacterized protein n=1 Tax=Gimesia fumaroli TaxID=2527976 RepID=A0A518I5N8_9PLAN|nr:hypothetical protein [Gimesia fumaroli]QDV48411.1 hypothetical protein Enr17x_04230 [Gimesia fumaroli]